jgi:serine/threonine protein kinase
MFRRRALQSRRDSAVSPSVSPNAASIEAAPRVAPSAYDDDLVARSRSRIGALIDGKYQLDDLLGVGSTGAVFRAHNRWAGRPCAVKLFHYEGPNDQDVLRRFLREAQAINRVRRNNRLHPNVVDALDVGRDSATGSYFVVQELLRGETFSNYLRRLPGRRLSLPNAMRILRPVIDAIACAHEGAVVHRDLKPDNVLLTRGEGGIVPKVLDFGIAQLTDERVTPVMEFIGTPLYMPPEAYGGAGYVDARADVWALGVMLYEALAGEHPFAPPNDAPTGCMELVLYRAPPSLAALGLVPPAVWSAMRHAISKPLSQRYTSAGELLAALDAAMRPVRVLRVGAGATLEHSRAALRDPTQHGWVAHNESRRTTPPPIERLTMPPPSMGGSPLTPVTPREAITRSIRPTAMPPANDADAVEEPFTGDPRDYWWSVQIQGACTAEDLTALLRLPELARVVELHASGCALGDAGVAALCEGNLLRDLAVLSLRRVGMTARGVASVAGSAALANVLKLDLEQNNLGVDGLRTLMAGRHMTSLRALSLVLCELDAEAAEALTESSKLSSIVRLDLSQNRLGDDGALRLARHEKLSPELWLSLSRNRVSGSAGELATRLLAGRVRKVVL